MTPADKQRVNDAFGHIYSIEGGLKTWLKDCTLILKLMEDKVKDKKTPQPERDANTKKRLPALKALQTAVKTALAAATSTTDALADTSLAQMPDAATFLKLHGAGLLTLAAEAVQAVKKFDAAITDGGVRYMKDEARIREMFVALPLYEKTLHETTSKAADLRNAAAPARPAAAAPAAKPANSPAVQAAARMPARPAPPAAASAATAASAPKSATLGSKPLPTPPTKGRAKA